MELHTPQPKIRIIQSVGNADTTIVHCQLSIFNSILRKKEEHPSVFLFLFYYAISAALRFLPFLTITMVVTTVVVTTALAMISHTKSQLMDSLFCTLTT